MQRLNRAPNTLETYLTANYINWWLKMNGNSTVQAFCRMEELLATPKVQEELNQENARVYLELRGVLLEMMSTNEISEALNRINRTNGLPLYEDPYGGVMTAPELLTIWGGPEGVMELLYDL